MAENTIRSTGRSTNYKFDVGNMPTEFGPYVGEVMNNVDPTRSGRIQVYIKQLAAGNKENPNSWRTMAYVSPFAGATPKTSTSTGVGTYGSTNNQQSYGMSFQVPDVGNKVLCFLVAGDPSVGGYYVGCIQEQGMNHMTPTIGAATQYATQNKDQSTYFSKSSQLPVTEINNAPQNTQVTENPQFFNQTKPVHSYVASALFQQGTVNDPIRGSITSSSQRESPSTAYGMSTPGRPIYAGGLNDTSIQNQLASGNVTSSQVDVVGRRGGHSIVLDDGDLSGKNQLIRIRTALGHQITMSDDGKCFYIAHANGQAWIEMGQEGTLDVYTTNSVNLRTQGTLNLHADQDININAGGNLSLLGNMTTTLQSNQNLNLTSKKILNIYGQMSIGVKTSGALALKSTIGAWSAGGELSLDAFGIDLNAGISTPITAVLPTPKGLTTFLMPDSEFNTSTGWKVSATQLKSIVTRAPAHEPWPYHNQGVKVNVNLSDGSNSSPPSAPTIPPGFSITQTGNSITSAAETAASDVSQALFDLGSATS